MACLYRNVPTCLLDYQAGSFNEEKLTATPLARNRITAASLPCRLLHLFKPLPLSLVPSKDKLSARCCR
jgi:hypothetical protein